VRTFLLPGLLWACSPDFEAPPGRAAVSLRVSPESVQVLTGPDGGQPVQFQAEVTWDDATVEVLDEADWSLSNQTTGAIDGAGLFLPGTTNGGVTWVTARLAGVEDTATATVVYEDAWVEEGADEAAFEAGADAGSAALWLYPEDGVNLPRNTPSIAFQWSDAALPEPAVAWRLRFSSAITAVSVYTTAAAWTADEESWQTLVSTNAGGELSLELSALTASGAVYGDAPRTVHVNRMDAEGSIYYWSSSAAGFRRIPYGGAAEDFLTQAQTGYCVGCHVISSQGRIAFTYDGGNGQLGLKRVDDGSDLLAYGAGVYGNFKTFSPDGSLLLTTYLGSLLVYDGLTGAYLSEVPTDGTVTHVDWDPDGSRVALVLTDSHSYDWTFTGGRLATMEHLGDGRFAAPTLLYDPGGSLNAYYPSFSPDGDWLAFNLSSGDSYDDEDAAVYVISPDGGPAIALDAANQTGGITNSWPRWGPLPDDDILWLSFSSKRLYGAQTSGNPQIWVSAFDPADAGAGLDGSYAAFWLPGQDVSQNNHVPVWVED
jgi:hypothetical protein